MRQVAVCVVMLLVAVPLTATVSEPVFVRHLTGQTSWFAGPIVYDLEGDGSNELIAAYYDVYVFSSSLELLDRAQDGSGRVYAPHVVADLENDGTTEVVAGRGHEVFAWEWTGSELVVKTGWPFDTTTAGSSPEVRGMAAGDLDGDGELEIFVQTFDHAMDVFTVPGSDTSGLAWPTARGGPLRSGAVHWTGCLPGDADGSISVGAADVSAVLRTLFEGEVCACPDTDCDGEVTSGDVAGVVVEWFDRGGGPCSVSR